VRSRVSRLGATLLLAASFGGNAGASPVTSPDEAALITAIGEAWRDVQGDAVRAVHVELVPLAELVAVTQGGVAEARVRVDPAFAATLDAVLEATAVAHRVGLRATLRRFAVDQANAWRVDRQRHRPETFWDRIGWAAPGHDLLRQQSSFTALVARLRVQSYRWVLLRAMIRSHDPRPAAAEPGPIARRLVDAGHWPSLPLAAAVLVAAADRPDRVPDAEALCDGARLLYVAAAEARRDGAARAALASDPELRASVRDHLLALDELNVDTGCGLEW
jgi:hypothetical protein